MKLTVKQLRKIINEEASLLQEYEINTDVIDATTKLEDLEGYVDDILNDIVDPIDKRLSELESLVDQLVDGTLRSRSAHQDDPYPGEKV